MLISIQEEIQKEVASQKGLDFEDVAIGGGGGYPTNQWRNSTLAGRIGGSCDEGKTHG